MMDEYPEDIGWVMAVIAVIVVCFVMIVFSVMAITDAGAVR